MPLHLEDDAHDDRSDKQAADGEAGSKKPATQTPMPDESVTPATKRSRKLSLSSEAKDQWKTLRKMIRLRAEKQSAKSVFGSAAKRGGVYRWGVQAATGQPLASIDVVLSRLACGKKVPPKDLAQINWQRELEQTTDQFRLPHDSPLHCARAVMWAAAMPSLIDQLDYTDWWELLGELQRFRESTLEKGNAASLSRLLVAGEMGLTMSWRLADLPSCSRMKKSSIDAIQRWCEHDEDSIAATIAGGRHARLGLASLIRCRSIMQSTMNRKFTKQQKNVLADLATWVAALTTQRDGSAFVDPTLRLRDDTSKNGLLDAVIACDADSLRPALNAVRGKTQTGGRLVWEISLPETVHHCDQSKLAVMLCEWDVNVGRLHIDYSSQDISVEVFGKKDSLISGPWQSTIEIDGNEQKPNGPWASTCEFTDDDVHYLELEQSWSGGVVLQRQFMTIRDDRTVLFADSVLPREPVQSNDSRAIRYSTRIPMTTDTQAKPEPETREITLVNGRSKALMIPLSASEWRTGLTEATLRETEDHHLLLSANGRGRLYVPIWIDFQSRRFKRKRTWRQLTVADELRIVRPDEAVGFRIQLGSEQWMVYRSLQGSRCRSVLGKHLIADFFASRFYMNDGSFEELVSVDDHQTE